MMFTVLDSASATIAVRRISSEAPIVIGPLQIENPNASLFALVELGNQIGGSLVQCGMQMGSSQSTGRGRGTAHKLRDRAVRTRRGVSGNRPRPIGNRPAAFASCPTKQRSRNQRTSLSGNPRRADC